MKEPLPAWSWNQLMHVEDYLWKVRREKTQHVMNGKNIQRGTSIEAHTAG